MLFSLLVAVLTAWSGELFFAAADGGSREPLQVLAAAGIVKVTNNEDSGAGSFRAAIEEANANPSVTFVEFEPAIGRVELSSAVVHSAAQDLRIDGHGVVLNGARSQCDCDALVSSGGGNLSLRGLTIENARRNGVLVVVPAGAIKDLAVELSDVTLRENGHHGLHVDDQVNGVDETGSDSDAGILIDIFSSTILANGFREGVSDFDGVRIDEGGSGDIDATVEESRVTGNAGDGIELDERGDGDVTLDASQSNFDSNGSQPQNLEDLEDGLDIDEANDGGVDARIIGSTARGNFDEGFDFSEDGPGDLRASMSQVEASGNVDEGIVLMEDEVEGAGGSIVARFRDVTVSENTADGIQFEEFGPGNLMADIVQSTVTRNAAVGIHVGQADGGEGVLRLQQVTLEGNAEGPFKADGVAVTGLAD